MERVIFHCDLNCFYASVELLSRPDLREVPTAVCGDPEPHPTIYRPIRLTTYCCQYYFLYYSQPDKLLPFQRSVTADNHPVWQSCSPETAI